MDRQQFFTWLNDPCTISEEGAGELQEIIRNYPYFQTARILHLLYLKQKKDYRFERELRKVAGFVADRARLRELLIDFEERLEGQAKRENESSEIIIKEEISKKDVHLQELEEQIKASLREIEMRKSRLKELLDEKEAITGESGQLPAGEEESGEKRPYRPLPKDPLLEEFLKQNEEPVEKPGFFSAEERAKKSIEENEDILSETLARLVAAQGKKEKAIKIYQKLMLKYPQKSNTFAAQIEKLRKEL